MPEPGQVFFDGQYRPPTVLIYFDQLCSPVLTGRYFIAVLLSSFMATHR